MEIRLDEPRSAAAAGLLREHLDDVRRHSPPQSVHALDTERLCAPDITFWTAWDNGELVGCAALRELDPAHGEIKSMRTARAHLRKGVASRLLDHIIIEAKRRGYARLWLETGAQPAFAPARALYARFGFTECGPFAEYNLDANSIFMMREP